MSRYKRVEVSEQKLEDLVRQNSDLIEEGLVFVDHQKQAAGGRLDVLFVDSGRSMVVAELKIIEDDGMLFQCLDYYDHIAARIETYARLYASDNIDPTKQVRILLVAPSFSQILINRCKWIDARISLFSYSCIKLEKSEDVLPVFSEQAIPSPLETVVVYKLDDHLSYITDAGVRARVSKLIEEIKQLKPGITMDALKYAISMKINNRVFAYLHPRRKHYVISTYNAAEEWTDYAIHSDDDLSVVRQFIAASVDQQSK